jgi:hypothetical protein
MNITLIPDNPDYGVKKLITMREFFFSYNQVLQTMNSMKSKKCHRYDNVLLIVLKDGVEVLALPFSKLFEKIYQTKEVPEISRTVPLY